MGATTEIKAGYKKTKLGWIPEDWEFKLLDEVSKRGSGHTPDKKKDEYYNGGIKWISLADSSKLDKGLISETKNDISELGIKNSSAVIHKKNTVLLSRDAGVGKSAVMYEDMAVSQHFIAWYTNESLCHYWFLYYLLQKNKREFERVAVGSTIKTIGLGYFKKLKIPLPPLPEQKKIADILSTWDKAIETTQALIQKLQLRKKGLMQQLLTGKKRLPGFEGEWEFVTLNSMITTKSKKINPKEYESLRCIELEHIEQETGRINGFINSLNQKSIKNQFEEGQVLFGKLRPYLRKFWRAEFSGVCSTEIWVLSILEDKLNQPFLFYFVQGHFFNSLANATSGSKMPRSDWNYMRDFETKIPLESEQTAIAQVLTKADEEISQSQNYLEQLQEQKKGLMQQLLTGQRRVAV